MVSEASSAAARQQRCRAPTQQVQRTQATLVGALKAQRFEKRAQLVI
jgi:hypothetical protein